MTGTRYLGRRHRRSEPGPWWLGWRVTQHKARYYWVSFAAWSVVIVIPAVSGAVIALAFDALAEGRVGRVYWLAVALATVEAMRLWFVHIGSIWFGKSWEFMRALLRANMLSAQLASGGDEAGPPIRSAGEAIARFRDDTDDVANFVDLWIDVTAGVLFTAVAVTILAAVDPLATAVMVGPMIVVAVVATGLARRQRRLHRATRRATAELSGFLGDVTSAAVTLNLTDGAGPVLDRLGALADHRRRQAVRARVNEFAIRSFTQSMADVGLGLVILVAAGSVRSGRFGVGELALFLTYGGYLGFLPRMLGLLLARREQVEVAFDEMRHLVADRRRSPLVAHRPLPVDEHHPLRPFVETPSVERLERLDVDGLGLDLGAFTLHPSSFSLQRGTMTVITGPIGAGKSTLLRALLGLVPAEGEVRWNGRVVADRAATLVPPRAAYLPQLPQLVSDTLADNILLGSADVESLGPALELAAVSADVAHLPNGVETVIGPRGLRLSGGQRQRVAAARALIRGAELVVLDDVSSALDTETEIELWQNLERIGATVLAVSHRRVALDRADQILVMADGRLEPAPAAR